MKTQTIKGYSIQKFNFDKPFANNSKIYKTKQDAENAGNSWKNDCTVHAIQRDGFWFEIHEIKASEAYQKVLNSISN